MESIVGNDGAIKNTHRPSPKQKARTITLKLIDPHADMDLDLCLNGNMARVREFCIDLQAQAVDDLHLKLIRDIKEVLQISYRGQIDSRTIDVVKMARALTGEFIRVSTRDSWWYVRKVYPGSITIEVALLSGAILYVAKKIVDKNLDKLITKYKLDELVNKAFKDTAWFKRLTRGAELISAHEKYKAVCEVKMVQDDKEIHITFHDRVAWREFVDRQLLANEEKEVATSFRAAARRDLYKKNKK